MLALLIANTIAVLILGYRNFRAQVELQKERRESLALAAAILYRDGMIRTLRNTVAHFTAEANWREYVKQQEDSQRHHELMDEIEEMTGGDFE